MPPAELAGDTASQPVVPERRPGQLGRSTAFFSIATGLSRIAGLLREVVAASYFGVRGPMSAFTIAFQVPNLVRSLFADAALQAAFVPVFTEHLEKGRKREAFHLAVTLFFLIVLVLGAITALFILLAPVIMPFFAPGFGPELTELTVHLSELLFPIVLLLGISGLIVGMLNSFEHFAVPAIAPLFWNLTIIVTLIVLTPQLPEDKKIYAYAWGVLIGTVVQLVLPIPWLRGRGGTWKPVLDWRDPAVRRVLRLMLPVTIGLGLINFNLSINSIFGTLVSDQAPAAIDKAFRVYMLPQGMFSVAVATVLFPAMSKFAARAAYQDMLATAANGTRQIFLLLIPSAAVMIVLAEPITRILYQRGAFDAEQTNLVAEAMFWFAFSLPFAGANLLLTRTFFSLQQPWMPTAIAVGNLGLTAGLNAVLYRPLGISGIVIATAVASAATFLAMAFVLRRRVGPLQGRRTLLAALQMTFAAALLGGIAYSVWWALDQLLGESFVAQAVSLSAALFAGGVAYAVTVMVMRIPEAEQIARLVRGRLGR